MKHFGLLFCLTICLLALGIPPAALAQTPAGEQPVLPGLPDKIYDIRGTLEISFPTLQRQPLNGFIPPPRIIELPANRRPYVEPYKQESADLPPSPLQRPEPPPVTGLSGASPRAGEVYAGAGRYFGRFGGARLESPLGQGAAFIAGLDYEGADGHAPFDELPDRLNPYDHLSGHLTLKTTQSRLSAGLRADGFRDNYTLFAVTRRTPFAEPPGRTGQGAALQGWVRTPAESAVAFGLDVRYGQSRFDTDSLGIPAPLDARFTQEQRTAVGLNVGVPFAAGQLRLDARAEASALDGDDLRDHTVSMLDAGGGYRFRTRAGHTLTLGARFLTFLAEQQTFTGVGTPRRKAAYLSPAGRLDIYPVHGLHVYAQNRPGLDPHPLAEVFQTNPYVVDNPAIQPTLRLIDAEAGLRILLGAVRLAGRGGYQDMPNYRFFEPNTPRSGNAFGTGIFAVRYAKARIVHLGGDVSLALGGRFHTTLGITLRDGSLPDDEVAIPYLPPLTAHAFLSYAFAESRGLFSLTSTYLSTRYADRTETTKAPAYLDLDATFTYDFTDALGVVFKANNLTTGDEARWLNYEQSPLMIMGGMRVRW